MSKAVIIFQGRPFAYTDTEASNGSAVSFGWTKTDDAIVEIGRGKISRSQKNLAAIDRYDLDYAHVNFGGGKPV